MLIRVLVKVKGGRLRMNDNVVNFDKVREFVGGCSLSNEVADCVDTRIRFHEVYCRGEKRPDLERLYAVAAKRDLRAAGGESWSCMLEWFDKAADVEMLLNWLVAVQTTKAIMVVGPDFHEFKQVQMDGKEFLLVPTVKRA